MVWENYVINTRIITTVFCAFVLVSCGNNTETSIKNSNPPPQKQETTQSVGKNKDNNLGEIEYHKKHKVAAQEYVKQVEKTVSDSEKKYQVASLSGQFSTIRSEAKISIRNIIQELNKNKEPFGTPLTSPLAKCSTFGMAAVDYLMELNMTLATPNRRSDIKFYKDSYKQELGECKEQINNPPTPIQYIVAEKGARPPYKNCYKIIEITERSDGKQEWSCPMSNQ